MDESNSKALAQDRNVTIPVFGRRKSAPSILPESRRANVTLRNKLSDELKQTIAEQIPGVTKVSFNTPPNSPIIDYCIKFDNLTHAENFSAEIYRHSPDTNLTATNATGTILALIIEQNQVKEVGLNIKNNVVIVKAKARCEELQLEVMRLQDCNWLKRKWYGLETKQAKIKVLTCLIKQIEQDATKSPAQHAQALRHQHPIVVQGFFSQRTRHLFNEIERPQISNYATLNTATIS